MLKNGHRPAVVTTDSENSASSGDSRDDPHSLEKQDELAALSRYAETTTHSASVQSLVPSATNGSTRSQRGVPDPAAFSNGAGPRPQRPTAPARTPSNTYQPYTQRRPGQNSGTSYISGNGPHARDGSRPRPIIGTSTFRAQEREYVRRLRQQDYNNGEDQRDPVLLRLQLASVETGLLWEPSFHTSPPPYTNCTVQSAPSCKRAFAGLCG